MPQRTVARAGLDGGLHRHRIQQPRPHSGPSRSVAGRAHRRRSSELALRFLGLEDFPKYRSGGRLENYRGRPPLSDAAFKVVAALVQAAAETLERIDQRFALSGKGQDRLVLAPALFQATLEELASS